MRFFEYESRAIVAKAGIPVTKHGFAKAPEEARAIAEDIAGPVVITSQVRYPTLWRKYWHAIQMYCSSGP